VGLARLHVEFVKLQQWVVHQGLKVCILFEGRDGAGKGGETDYPFRVVPKVYQTDAERGAQRRDCRHA
jgi:polyphosphate kinase